MSEPWTPGPWRVGGLFGISVLKGDAPISGDDYRTLVCEVYSSNEDTDLEAAATARLIAAAPEMAEALAAFNLKEEMIVGGTADALVLRVPLAIIQQAAAALRKARGEP